MYCNWGWNNLWHFGGPLFWGIILVLLMAAAWKIISARSAGAPGAPPCYQCGSQVEHSFMRCPQCGAELKKHCPECSRIVETGWKYCPSCSISLKDN